MFSPSKNLNALARGLAVLSAIAIAASSTLASAAPETPAQRAQRLFRYEPQIFERKSHFPFNPDEVLRSYQELMTLLQTVHADDYQKIAALKGTPLKLTLDVKGKVEAVTYEINPAAIRRWKGKLRDTLSDILPSSSSTNLSKRLSDSLIEAATEKPGFLTSAHTLQKRVAMRAQLLTLLEDILSHQSAPVSQSEIRWDLIDGVEALKEADIDWFMETDVTRPLLENVLPPKVLKASLAALEAFSKDLGEQKVAVKPAAFFGKLTLLEMPAEVALARGVIGDDCSTSSSSNYAASPLERVFFIYDESGTALGFMNATQLQFNGVPAIYVNTIGSSRMTTAQADAILRAVYANREAFGVTQMVLPVREKLFGNINFTSVREAFFASIQGGESGELSYLDAPVRRWIDQMHRHAPYDRADQNRTGIRYEPRPTTTEMTTEVAHRTAQEMSLDSQPLDKWDALAYAFSQAKLSRSDKSFTGAVLDSAGLTTADLKHFVAWVENFPKQNLGDYQATVHRELAALGVDPSAEFLSTRGAILKTGIRACPDLAPETGSAPRDPEPGICNLLMKK